MNNKETKLVEEVDQIVKRYNVKTEKTIRFEEPSSKNDKKEEEIDLKTEAEDRHIRNVELRRAHSLPLETQPLHLIFDLNGTLIQLSDTPFALDAQEKKQDILAGRQRQWNKRFLRFRPHLDGLFHTVFYTLKCKVAVWSFSSRPKTAQSLVDAVFGKYASQVFVFSNEMARKSKRKDLNLFWNVAKDWNPKRTLLVEDSISKLIPEQVTNALLLPTYNPQKEDNELLHLQKKLLTLAKTDDVRKAQEKLCIVM